MYANNRLSGFLLKLFPVFFFVFFLLVSPCRERDRSEDQHLRDQFRARVGHGYGESALPHLR